MNQMSPPPNESLSSGMVDLIMTFLREQDELLKELMQDVGEDSMSVQAVKQRIVQIEGNLKKLRSVI